jgi:hypothetical protein
VIVEERLRLAANPSGRERVIVQADAHMLGDPLALVVRSEDSLATAEGAGRAIGSLFPANRDRQKVAWAWVSSGSVQGRASPRSRSSSRRIPTRATTTGRSG